MDKDQLLAVQEEDQLELTNLSRNCILHALEVLPKITSTPNALSDLEKINQFCREISATVNSKKKKAAYRTITEEDALVEPKVINQFYKGEMSPNDFLLQIETRLDEILNEDFDHDALFRTCWQVYCTEKTPQIAFSQHFSDDSIYHLWLIFNAVLPPESDMMLIPVKSLNVIMKRMLNLCAHEPISYYYSGKKVALEYQEYLQAIADSVEPLKLQPLLIHEVTQDMKDEIIDGILKKGYLTKKGHKRKNWKRRWFILEKTVVKYFECKENPVQKGQMALNTNTEVSCIPDRGKRMYCFQVTCGKTKTIYEIQSDDEKSRHDWMLAINKAIHLSKIFEGRATPDIGRSSQRAYLPNFHLIRFGLSQSIIPKWEGGIKIRQKPGSGISHRVSTISSLRKIKLSMTDSDDELSEEEENKTSTDPIPITTRRQTETWVTINISATSESQSSASVQSSVPSLWGAFGEQEHSKLKKRATSDTLSMHGTSVDRPHPPDSEPTTVFEELKDEETSLIKQGSDAATAESPSGPNSSPKLDQQVGHIKKKPPPGADDSPILSLKYTHN